MDVRRFVLKETGIIAISECICVAAMLGIFALIGKFDGKVLLGGIAGGILAVLNFFLMAIAADAAADKAAAQDIKGGKAKIRTSFLIRMILLFVVLFAFAKSKLCNPFALVIPFVFVQPAIMITEFFRKSGDKKHEC